MNPGFELDFAANELNILQQLKTVIDPELPTGYEILNNVGEGAMGSVYSLTNSSKDFLAAKIVGLIDETNVRNKIIQEYNIQRLLRHRNIGEVYGIRNVANYIIIFMELLTGGDLFDLIPIDRGINTIKGFNIYKQLLNAVEYCHNKQIVHLDIKPENVMLSLSNIPKLIDFGLAVNHNDRPFLNGHIGTSAYSAPETFLDRPYTGYKADLFSLNITFLTMVTGERCWNEAKLNDPYYADWYEKRWEHSMLKRLPTDLLSFLIGALAYNPSDRFSIDQIRNHIWYRNGLVHKIKAIKTHGPAESHAFDLLPKSQPMTGKDVLNTSFSHTDIGYDLPLSQPLDLGALVMPPCDAKKKQLPIVKRMTRFFSTQNNENTFYRVTVIIEQHQHCTVIQKSSNHLMVQSDLSGITTGFRIFVYNFDDSILVDFRRVRGDGLLFINIFNDIMITARQLGLVNDTHPALDIVQPPK